MLGKDVGNGSYPSAAKGEAIFTKLQTMAETKNITIRIVSDITQANKTQDLQLLANYSNVKVRNLNFRRLWESGIIHTKLWVIDGKHFYLGSANMDWRSLTQVLLKRIKSGKS